MPIPLPYKPLIAVVFACFCGVACRSNSITPSSSPSFNPIADASAAQPETLSEEITRVNSSIHLNQSLTCNASPEQFQTTFIALINQARAESRQCGDTSHQAAPPIRWNAQLAVAAERHSIDMSENNFFSHTGSGNTSVADRVDATHYEWKSVGENLAAGQATAREAIEGWLSSPGHCRNIMNTSYEETGVTCKENQSTNFSTYWTNVFGAEFD